MKTLKIFHYLISFSFKVERVKRIVVAIPDNADEAHLRIDYFDDDKGKRISEPRIVYWDADGPQSIKLPNLPDYHSSKEVFLTPLYEKGVFENGHPVYAKNRKIVIDLFY